MTAGPNNQLPRHGGDLSAATARFGQPADGWLDLSTGVNPVGYPAEAAPYELLARLPETASLEALQQAFRRYAAVRDETGVAVVPGSEFAIRQLPTIVACEKVAIVAPTYGSHAEAWTATGCEVAEVPELDLVAGDAGAVVIANPNNPDGRSVAIDPLMAMAHRLAARGGALIVDEAFADVTPERSLVPHLDKAPAIVLRSFGKFFGLPGLRLGFCLGPRELIARLEARLGDWPVSSLALVLGRRALDDTQWQTATRQRLAADAAALDACLADHHLDLVGGTDLFRLATHAGAAKLHEHLARHGILTRIFNDQRQWIRFGVPVGSDALARLSEAFASFDR